MRLNWVEADVAEKWPQGSTVLVRLLGRDGSVSYVLIDVWSEEGVNGIYRGAEEIHYLLIDKGDD